MSKYNTVIKALIQKGLDRLEEKAEEPCGALHSKYQFLHLDGITLYSSTAWGSTAAVTRALKSLEITKILLGKD